ncbi:ABC transporter ATP-binding protein [Dickeya undicola]|uniref:ABC transporter ATP-binding protein n=1 Tax=Dickeya undicola TaxID=1577887 RepID=A0A3N0GDF8_9GAMM|nr:ABC transporter ATP-binding protein [Dickeya undicola]RNM24543.1 ABC transporter ATP-binding protein [Dickeya undicola]
MGRVTPPTHLQLGVGPGYQGADRKLIPVIRIENLHHRYGDTVILRALSLHIRHGETCAILGRSGSGKSTLLNVLGLLEPLQQGSYHLDGEDIQPCSNRLRARLRNQKLGFVFQHFHLLSSHSVLDNVALPLLYRNVPVVQARRRAAGVLGELGMYSHRLQRPATLSGGQRQRVALARALVGEPTVLLADEPTGNLDAETAQEIINLLLDINRQRALTLVMVTHDERLAQRLQRRCRMHDGVLIAE